MYKLCRDYVKKNILFILMIIICFVLGVIYVNQSARDIVFMDFWRNGKQLIPAVMEKKCTFQTFWSATGGQRNFLQMFLLALNIRFLKLNCMWEVYGGICVLILSIILVYIVWGKMIDNIEIEQKNIIKQILFLPVIFSITNLNQWEILSLQFSFAFMLRIFSFLLIFAVLNQGLKKNIYSPKLFGRIGVFAGLVICFLSQLYFPAMLFSVVTIFLLRMFGGVSADKIKEFFCFFIPCIVAVFYYFYNIETSSITGGIVSLWDTLKSGEFFMGLLYMLVGSMIPQTTIEKMNMPQITEIGFVLLGIVVIAIVLYFVLRIYEYSYFPLILIMYGLISIPIIIYGRVNTFSLYYLTSSRYVCETTLIWVGCTLIFAFTIINNSKWILKIITGVLITVITIIIFSTDLKEFRIAPYRGFYKEELLSTLKEFDESEIDDDTLSLFQAPVDIVREVIILMKKYHLNVYK
ncbi:MAG: hypothetical protein OSJ62_02800 [Lachnospiraceae bacterium]|nr:hypothetical protein [Lachnospiraceae bacterium]